MTVPRAIVVGAARPFAWLVTSALVAAAAVPLVTQSSPVSPASTLRFHHAHYQVGDPAAAMNEAARRLEGVRVIAQGLGVGVRAGREYLLFDRAAAEIAPAKDRTALHVYARTIDRLTRWGFSASPEQSSAVRALTVFPDLPIDHLAFTADDYAAAVQRVETSGATVRSRQADAVIVDAGDGLAIEILRDTDRQESFWCPMHPDIRSPDAGKCPLCAMDLVPIPPPKIGEYKLDVAADRDRGSGTIRALRLGIHEPDTNGLVTKLEVVHEQTLHLFVISSDLQFFAHVHPVRREDGTYELKQLLPAGEYMLIADFLPVGGTPQMVQRAVISGRAVPRPAIAPAADEGVRTVTVDGIAVTLDAGRMTAGKEVLLTFSVADARTGAPVTDLQPYLGAPAHLLIVRTDLGDAIHGHPEEVTTPGPTVSFHPLVPSPGDYRLWIQFQRGGRVITVPFWLRAER